MYSSRILKLIPIGSTALALALPAAAAEPVDFTKQIKPILEVHCVKCHSGEKPKGRLVLETRAEAVRGGENGTSLTPGKPEDSPLYTSTVLPPDHDNIMPPSKEPPLKKEQTELLKAWIQQGANWPDGAKLAGVRRMDFVKDIQPIFEFECVRCHHDGEPKGSFSMNTKASTFKGGNSGPGVVPGKPMQSLVYVTTALATNHEMIMPPIEKGGPLTNEMIKTIATWIEQGAIWPEGTNLVARKKEQAPGGDEGVTVAGIHAMIMAKLDVKNAADMKTYTNTIPGTQVTYGMVPLPAGEFTMGSPAGEAGRNADEGPQHKVKLAPFWMGVCEVTWNEYELFMYKDEEWKFKNEIKTDPEVDKVSELVSRPTKPYVEMSFGMGKDGYPAISMTHHAASKYCQWLSAKTGHYYRLPTEAEWEYACRAGTATKYNWGDDAAQTGDFAWFEKNSDFKYQKVGRKKPNAWGLYDMHGNVAEWCIDGYDAAAYDKFAAGAENPWVVGTKPYPHVARGGSWDDTADKLRAATRRFSDKTWKQQDPQLPKSIWYLTDAQFLGFRLVRPLTVPPAAEMQKVWNNGVERE
jgi:formylglycine-generating enzyme required for sulfatase activity